MPFPYVGVLLLDRIKAMGVPASFFVITVLFSISYMERGKCCGSGAGRIFLSASIERKDLPGGEKSLESGVWSLESKGKKLWGTLLTR
jgi:hypothetical protein